MAATAPLKGQGLRTQHQAEHTYVRDVPRMETSLSGDSNSQPSSCSTAPASSLSQTAWSCPSL